MGQLTPLLKRWTFRLVAGLCVSLVVPIVAPAFGGDVAVVVHPDVPADNLSVTQVRKLFVGDRQFWSSDLRVTLLIPAPVTPERDILLKLIYRMSEAQFRHYWIAKVFRAESPVSPKTIYSSKMTTELVGSIPGCIAFVDVAQVPKGLKIVKINGYLPGERGYPLR